MTTLRIHHCTRYRYERPVAFGVHRLMLRPRDGHDMRILSSALSIFPAAEVTWEFDTFGNCVAYASFSDMADELVIQSDLVLRRYGPDEPVARLAPRAVCYPFAYGQDELIDLAPMLRLQCEEDRGVVAAWLQAVVPTPPEGSLDLLQALSAAIYEGLAYRRREEQGVQTPGQTLATGSGTCRDFAFLFMEAARHLGFAARFVTGYLYDPAVDDARDAGPVLTGGGATHAWADIFVPGAGWIEFDPTNRIVAGKNLVRVATTRSPSQALPIEGSYRHDGTAFLGMEVTVSLTEAAGSSVA
jgi:transglutaminase-like putative cysteine protease